MQAITSPMATWETTEARLHAFPKGARWQFAYTMRRFPHWYTLREESDGDAFEAFVVAIREYGYDRPFQGKMYRCLDVDAWTYWTMGAPVEETILINRARHTTYHTALSGGIVNNAPPVAHVAFSDGSVALRHDLFDGPLPDEYDACDLLYTEIIGPPGVSIFGKRAGVQDGRTYRDVVDRIGDVIRARKTPVALVGLKSAIERLPTPHLIAPVKLNKDAVIGAVYGLDVPKLPADNVALIRWLAHRYDRVGDFMCGYGLTGRIFREAGKAFVLSDYNASCIGYIAMNADGWHA